MSRGTLIEKSGIYDYTVVLGISGISDMQVRLKNINPESEQSKLCPPILFNPENK